MKKTRFEELQAKGERMTQKEIADGISAMMMDERFAAVLGFLRGHREAYVRDGSGQNMAAHHGQIAHAMGSVYAMDTLLAQLSQFEPNRKKAKTPDV